MSRKIGDFLKDINYVKKNIQRDAEDNPPMYPIMRLLSYHTDAILYVNEMNRLARNGAWNDAIYDYLLYSLPKSKRFAKMKKELPDEDIEAIMKYFCYSRKKAEEVLPLLNPEQLREIKEVVFAQENT